SPVDWARAGLDNAPDATVAASAAASMPMEAIVETGIYSGDPVVRRAASLQKTADARACTTARFHPATLAALGASAGERVRVRQGGGETSLVAAVDAGLPEGCVRLARGLRETAALGDGPVAVEKERAEVAA